MWVIKTVHTGRDGGFYHSERRDLDKSMAQKLYRKLSGRENMVAVVMCRQADGLPYLEWYAQQNPEWQGFKGEFFVNRGRKYDPSDAIRQRENQKPLYRSTEGPGVATKTYRSATDFND